MRDCGALYGGTGFCTVGPLVVRPRLCRLCCIQRGDGTNDCMLHGYVGDPNWRSQAGCAKDKWAGLVRSDCGSRGECFVLLLFRIFTGSYRGAVLVSAM